MSKEKNKISLSGKNYLIFTITITSVVTLLHLASLPFEANESLKISKFFSLRNELNLPTFLSTVNLMFGGGLAALIFQTKAKREKRFWACVTILLLVMGYDEAAGMHEYYGSNYGPDMFNNIFNLKTTWLNTYLPAVILIGGFLAYEIRKIDAAFRLNIILPALLFISGAIGLELITHELGLRGQTWQIIIETSEELFEIFAIIWLNHSMLKILETEEVEIVIHR